MNQPPEGPAVGVPTCYRHPDRETYVRCQRCERPICPDCMRDAAVGFQCPGCVAEGARSTRSGRTTYGGVVRSDPSRTTLGIIVVNALVWVAVLLTGGRESRVMETLMLLPRGRCDAAEPGTYYRGINEAACQLAPGGTWVDGVATGAPWQVITHAFTHVEVWHIGFNMLALWVLGPQLESVLGRARYLALFLVSVLTAGTTVLWFSHEQGATVGASGAVWGLLGALLVVVWKVGGDVRTIMVWLVFNLVFTFTFPNISWQGHLGGLAGGAIVAALLVFSPRGPARARVQWTGIGVVAVVTAALAVLRALALA